MYLKKELYELIRTDESIFDFIQESSLDGLWYWDLEKPENEWMNAKFWTVLGYNPDEMPHKSSAWQNIINQDDLQLAYDNFTKHCENPNHPYNQIVRYTHKDGSTVWIRCRGLAIRDNTGKPIRMLGAHQDITDIKKREQELNKAKERAEESEKALQFKNEEYAAVNEEYSAINEELLKTNDELLKAKERAEESEAKLKTSDRIFNHSMDMLCIAGFDGYFKVLNPAWTRILGWSNEELLSKPWVDFVHPDDRDNTQDIGTVIVDGKEVYQFENRYICKDGSIKWLSWNSFPYPEENIMFGVARDVTVSKQREMIINNFFEQPLNINLIADFDGKINKINSAWEIYLGYTKDEIIGKKLFDFIHPDDISITNEEMKRLERGITTFHFENRYRHKNGEYRKLAWSSISSLDEQLVYAVAIDITEKQQAELALRQSEAIKNAMVSNIGDVIVIIDKNRINQYKSPNVTKFFGWEQEELIGKSTWDNVHPDDLEAGKEFIDSIASKPNATGTTEIRYKRKDGEYVWIEISVINLLHDKDIQGILGNYQDITERKEQEEILQRFVSELYESEKKLKIALDTKKKFFSIIAHDLRGPFSGFLGLTNMLSFDAGDIPADEIKQIAKSMNQSANALYKLIEDLLLWSQSQTGSITFKPVSLQTETLINDILNPVKDTAKLKNLLIEHEIQNCQTIRGDRQMINTILRNLISNAIKFSNKNGRIIVGAKRITVTNENQSTEEMCQLFVRDEGVGIPENVLSKMFVTSEKNSTRGTANEIGTGLGLILCQEFVERHDGKIWVESEVGKGSTFYFTLPYNAEMATETIDRQLTQSDKNYDVRKLKILIVEDDETSEKLIERYIKIFAKEIL